MKTFKSIIAVIFAFVACFTVFAATIPFPEIPVPQTSAVRAIGIADEQFDGNQNPTLVAVEWSQASAFKPRIGDGSSYSAADDDPEGWSWFLTYVSQESDDERLIVIRVKGDGSIGRFIGTRT